MKEVVFVSAVRTAVGRYSLANEIVHKMVTNFRNSPPAGEESFRETTLSSEEAAAGVHPVDGSKDGDAPIMEHIVITSQYDSKSRKKLVKYLGGTKE
jgi:hypothetical protein